MRHIVVLVFILFTITVVTANYCYTRKSCGKTCTGWWIWRRCKTKYCSSKQCCSGYCRSDCGTLCERLQKVTYACTGTCSKRTCSGWLFRRRCKTKYYGCSKVCTKEVCRPPWTGKNCDEKPIVTIRPPRLPPRKRPREVY